MSDEISLLISMSVVNGNFRSEFKPPLVKIDQAASGRGGYTQIIGTSEEVVNLGDIVTEGWLFLLNTDGTNFVTYGPEDTGAMVLFGKIEPGEPAAMRIAPGVVLRAKADTSDVKLDVLLLED